MAFIEGTPPSSDVPTSDVAHDADTPSSRDLMVVQSPDAPRQFKGHLPNEIISKIILMAHASSPLPPSILRINQACHAFAGPLVYQTIHLNRFTLSKLVSGLLDTDPKPDNKPLKWHTASRQRAIDHLRQATTLIIDDIPILFRPEFDNELHHFCKVARLPNVTKIIFCENEGEPTEEEKMETSYDITAPNREKTFANGPSATRAALFREVLTSEVKHVCVQIPSSGKFTPLGFITGLHLTPAYAPLVYYSGRYLRRHTRRKLPALERILEYIELFSGQVKVRIHQNLFIRPQVQYELQKDYINLNVVTRVPATYVYNRIERFGNGSATREILNTFRAHTNIDYKRYWKTDDISRERFGRAIRNLIIDKADDERIQQESERFRQWEVPPEQTREASLNMFADRIKQGISCLQPDSTTPCPCCNVIGVPLRPAPPVPS